jgi:hypothetical protein
MSRLPTPLQTHVATPDTSLAAGEHADDALRQLVNAWMSRARLALTANTAAMSMASRKLSDSK